MRHLSLRSTLVAAALLFAGPAVAAPVSWTYDSKIDVSTSVVDNLNGTYSYTLSLTNTDTADIWFSNVYTRQYQAYNLTSSIGAWAANAYTQFTTDGSDWNISGLGDSWFAGFYDTGWPQAGSLGVGQTATVGFTVNGLISEPIYYGYWVRDDYAWNRFTAVGIADAGATVPEPSTLALLGIGLVGLVAGRSRLRARK